jgi:2-dehydro-3-deoxygluconokinase
VTAPDVIALGETMLSLVAVDGDLASATVFSATHGGAESNACVELAARGLRPAWVSRLGADPAGDRIRGWLEDAGVDLTWVATDPDRPTGLMLRDTAGGVRYWRGGSAASAISPADLRGVPVEAARAVIVTGITAMLGVEPARAATALLDRARGTRLVDLNIRSGLWGSARARELLSPLVERCDVLVGSADELRTVGPGEGEELARACASLGPREVVVRSTDRVAALDDAGRWVVHDAIHHAEVDPVGAGDAFDAAYLATRLAGGAIAEALATGADAGALVATGLGDTGARR